MALFGLDLRANLNNSHVLVWFGGLLFANTLLNLMRSVFFIGMKMEKWCCRSDLPVFSKWGFEIIDGVRVSLSICLFVVFGFI